VKRRRGRGQERQKVMVTKGKRRGERQCRGGERPPARHARGDHGVGVHERQQRQQLELLLEQLGSVTESGSDWGRG
jgi:hypothetical protein